MTEYIELYKKYRPRVFEEVVGQDTIVNSLRNAILTNKIPTGYLFSGTAGTGKTTLALIVAKALNCENRTENGNPCNKCATCKAIDNNTLIGIKYISMANNGSAEDIRRLMEETRVAQSIKKKVYILDEVQNMSSAAQDAMLIGLESEQQQTLFICCTTDPEKVKPAILSRLQHRTLRELSILELTQNLINIVKKEPELKQMIKDKKITKENLVQCSQMAEGSVRNSIANLETLASSGVLPSMYSLQIVECIAQGDVVGLYELSEKMANEGVNINKSSEQVYRLFVQLLKGKASGNEENISENDIINRLSGQFILVCLEELGKTLNIVSNKVIDYRILFEVCYTKLALLQKKQLSKS